MDETTSTESESAGQAQAMRHAMPYQALTDDPSALAARAVLSTACARRWHAYPIRYDPYNSLLTLAVSDMEQAERIERIHRFFMSSFDLAFTIATVAEISESIERLFGRGNQPPVKKPKLKRIPAPWGSPRRAVAEQETDEAPTPDTAAPAESSAELSGALTSAVSLLVSAHLGDRDDTLGRVRACARYCRLMATRVNLSVDGTSRLVLAAWLSALRNKRHVIRQFASPYDLESIIYGQHECVESLILTLIECYQELESESPETCGDVNQVRRNLHVRWPAASTSQDILETFLQVLMDEQFLGAFDKAAGHILLMDPSGGLADELETSLGRSGYTMTVVSAPLAAQEFFFDRSADMILVRAEQRGADAQGCCRQLKTDPATKDVPLLVLLPSDCDLRDAEFLRTGADDCLNLPVDMELLYLKIEKQRKVGGTTNRGGVQGSLSDMSFCDMMQVLSAGAKNTAITMTSGDHQGTVFLKNGDVVHAELDGQTGEHAFYQFMRWEDGTFYMVECSDFPEPTITSSTMSLLMEGARLADEGLDVRGQ